MMLLLLRRLILIVASPDTREWIAAMFAEACDIPGPARLGWYVAAARVALGSRMRVWSLALQSGAFALLMFSVDWISGALLPALALIAISAAVLTRNPQRRHAAFLVAAGTLPLAHAVVNWVPALRPHYQYAPLDLRDWIILAFVAAIGFCAVQISSALWSARDLARADP